MKKVLIIVAAAIAATFSMTSCVETTESASVAALREAKAEQYRALADMYRAQAAADSLRAAAEAAIDQAKAAYKQALADSVQNYNDFAAQRYALYLEWLKMDFQRQMLDLEQQMADQKKTLAENNNKYITYLYTNYQNKVKDLNDLNQELFLENINLAKANANLLKAQDYVAQKTAEYTEDIEKAQAKIEVYNNYSGMDRADIQAQYDALKLNVDVLLSDMTAKGKLSTQAYQDVTEYVQDYFTLNGSNHTEIATTVSLLKIIDSIYAGYNSYATGTLVKTENKAVEKPSDFDYTETFFNQPSAINYVVYSIDAEVRETVIDAVEAEIETYIETELGVPGTETTAATLLYLAEQIAKTQLDNVNASPNATDAEKETAQKNYEKALAALAEGEAKLAEKEADLANLNRLLKAYDDGYAAYEAELSAFVEGELVKAYYQACIDYEAAYDLYMENNAQMDALFYMLYTNGGWKQEPITDVNGNPMDVNGDGYDDYTWVFIPNESGIIDVQAMIEAQEEIITLAEANIEALGFIDDIDTDNPAQNEVLAQYLIDTITANIAQLEQEIAIMQQIVDEAKAALDEALADNDETPAE